MQCPSCGANNYDRDARVCSRCGRTLPVVDEPDVPEPDAVGDVPAWPAAQPFLMPCSVWKLVVLTGLTGSLYSIYWFWMNWTVVRSRGVDVSPFWRTVFGGIYFYPLSRLVLDEANRREVRSGFSPLALTALLWAVGVGVRIGPDAWWLVLLSGLPFVPVQRTINRLNAVVAPQASAQERFTRTEIALAVPLALLWLFAGVGALLPVQP